jgi:hypothetical protein
MPKYDKYHKKDSWQESYFHMKIKEDVLKKEYSLFCFKIGVRRGSWHQDG